MEAVHTIMIFIEHLRNILMAMPERKLMPIAAFAPIVIFGSMFAWHMIKFYFLDEKAN